MSEQQRSGMRITTFMINGREAGCKYGVSSHRPLPRVVDKQPMRKALQTKEWLRCIL